MASFTVLFIKRTIGTWSYKFKESTNGFRILLSRLFHSTTVDGKKVPEVFMFNIK